MAFKFIILAAFVAVANAGLIGGHFGYVAAPSTLTYQAAPIATAVVAKASEPEYEHNPQYSYGYDVQDSLTGDSKSQHETRNGDAVKGSYSLLESDGTRRTVDYTADDVNGFNAVVRKEPAQVAIKTVAVAPVVKTVVAAPAVYSAPVVHHSDPTVSHHEAASSVIHHSAPVVHYSAPTVSHLAAESSVVYHSVPVAHYSAPAYYH